MRLIRNADGRDLPQIDPRPQGQDVVQQRRVRRGAVNVDPDEPPCPGMARNVGDRNLGPTAVAKVEVLSADLSHTPLDGQSTCDAETWDSSGYGLVS